MIIRSPQDFWAGIAFLATGTVFAIAAQAYDTDHFGPGFLPFWLGLILAGLGVLMALRALRIDGPVIERPPWSRALPVLFAALIFGALLERAGLLLTAMALVCVACLAARCFKAGEMALLAVGLSIFSCCIFVLGLKLPMRLCPDIAFFHALAFCQR